MWHTSLDQATPRASRSRPKAESDERGKTGRLAEGVDVTALCKGSVA
jgi:hypothetical protein